MKHKLTLTMAIAGACALASVSANANTIAVGPISSVPDGSGGSLWTYPIVFANSSISSGQPTAFNLNDFGALKTTGALPLGYTFTPGVAFTLNNALNVGPSFGLPGFQPNNAAVLDVVVTFTGSANLGAGFTVFNLVLDTADAGTGGLANFFSQDLVATGTLAGSPNAVQQNITTPKGVIITTPDSGTTITLLGFALAGLAGLRRKLTV